mgnify:CR=1 FL=1
MRIISKYLSFTKEECSFRIEHEYCKSDTYYIIGYQEDMKCIIFCTKKGTKCRATTRDSWNKIQINRPHYCDEKNYFLHTDYITNDKLIEEVKNKYYGQNFL